MEEMEKSGVHFTGGGITIWLRPAVTEFQRERKLAVQLPTSAKAPEGPLAGSAEPAGCSAGCFALELTDKTSLNSGHVCQRRAPAQNEW